MTKQAHIDNDGNYSPVASVYNKPDAELIKAAPNLIAAAKLVEIAFNFGKYDVKSALADAIRALREAISRAER